MSMSKAEASDKIKNLSSDTIIQWTSTLAWAAAFSIFIASWMPIVWMAAVMLCMMLETRISRDSKVKHYWKTFISATTSLAAMSYPIWLWFAPAEEFGDLRILAVFMLCALTMSRTISAYSFNGPHAKDGLFTMGLMLLTPIVGVATAEQPTLLFSLLCLGCTVQFLRGVMRLRVLATEKANALRDALDEALEHKTLSDQLFSQNVGSVVVVDADFRFLRANAGAMALLPSGALAGKNLSDLCTNLSDPDFSELRRVLHGETITLKEHAILRHTGQIAYMNWSAAPLRSPQGEILGAIISSSDVSDLVAMRRAAQEEAALSAMLFNQSPIHAMMFDSELRLVRVSERVNKVRDHFPFIGQSIDQFAADSPDAWRTAMRRALSGAITTGADEPCRAPSGELRYYNWEVRPWFDGAGVIKGVVCYSQDVSEAVASRHAEKTGTERLVMALESSKSVVMDVDLKNRSIKFYGDPVAVYGCRPTFDDLFSKHSQLYFPGDAFKHVAEFHAAVLSGKAEVLSRISRPDSGEAWVRANVHAHSTTTTGFEGFVLIAKDVTRFQGMQRGLIAAIRHAEVSLESKNNLLDDVIAETQTSLDSTPGLISRKASAPDPKEEIAEESSALDKSLAALKRILQEVDLRDAALAQAFTGLNTARKEADAANVAKSQFLATMSHELRTPLNAVIGYSEMLLEGAEDEGRTSDIQDINRILNAGRSLLRLINELLDLSKIEAGHMEVSLEDYEPDSLIKGVIDTVRPQIQKNGNSIEYHIDPLIGPGRSDAFKLNQCLLNLLSNAAKFTSNGVIRIHASLKPSDLGEILEIAVSDSGIGMTQEQLERVFKPFAQADSSTTRKYGGTGLGLVITRSLMQLMGGDVSVTSQEGAGSTFTLSAPLRLEPPMADSAQPARSAA